MSNEPGALVNIENEKYESPDIDPGPLTLAEYDKVIRTLKVGKAKADDIISAEVLKNCDFRGEILEFCNSIHVRGQKPSQISLSNIIPVPKKGDLTIPSNYRGIAVSSIISKILNKMIHNRVKHHIEPILRNNQNGARSGRSTAGLVLTIRRILEGIKERNLNAVMVFVDFKKAYDSIKRPEMIQILSTYGIPEPLLKTIELLYTDTWAKVVTSDGSTTPFEITSGILQGDTLAPYLFIICIDYCMKKAIGNDEIELGFTLEARKSRRHPPKVITDADFVDDLCQFSDNTEAAQKFLLKVEEQCSKVGLHINAKKTEFMSFNQNSPTIKTLNGSELAKADDFSLFRFLD